MKKELYKLFKDIPQLLYQGIYSKQGEHFKLEGFEVISGFNDQRDKDEYFGTLEQNPIKTAAHIEYLLLQSIDEFVSFDKFSDLYLSFNVPCSYFENKEKVLTTFKRVSYSILRKNQKMPQIILEIVERNFNLTPNILIVMKELNEQFNIKFTIDDSSPEILSNVKEYFTNNFQLFCDVKIDTSKELNPNFIEEIKTFVKENNLGMIFEGDKALDFTNEGSRYQSFALSKPVSNQNLNSLEF